MREKRKAFVMMKIKEKDSLLQKIRTLPHEEGSNQTGMRNTTAYRFTTRLLALRKALPLWQSRLTIRKSLWLQAATRYFSMVKLQEESVSAAGQRNRTAKLQNM